MTRIGVSAGFSSSSLPPARRCRRKLWTCPYRPGGLRHLGAPRSFAAVYRRRLPARATTVYNNTKATELTQAGNGGVRRAAVSGGGQLMKRPLTGRNHHIHILLAVSQSKMTWSFHEPSQRKNMMKHNFDVDFFCRLCTYLVYIEQAERREYTTVQSIVV